MAENKIGRFYFIDPFISLSSEQQSILSRWKVFVSTRTSLRHINWEINSYPKIKNELTQCASAMSLGKLFCGVIVLSFPDIRSRES